RHEPPVLKKRGTAPRVAGRARGRKAGGSRCSVPSGHVRGGAGAGGWRGGGGPTRGLASAGGGSSGERWRGSRRTPRSRSAGEGRERISAIAALPREALKDAEPVR